MKIFIGNLSAEVTSHDLFLLFSNFGAVVEANVAHDKEGQSRRFGYVQMKAHDEAKEAISVLDKKKFMEQFVTVSEAIPGEKHSKSAGN